jgi:hypothetical protein
MYYSGHNNVQITRHAHFAPVDLNSHRKESYINYDPRTDAVKEGTGMGRRFFPVQDSGKY